MVDLLLLAGRLLLVALLYLFLFFVVKTGVGLVRGQNKKAKSWTLNVEKGPRTLKGVRLTIAGPIVIGQAAEFDYAGTQACLALKEEGYEVVLCNSNPATIMTDTIIADRTEVSASASWGMAMPPSTVMRVGLAS